MMVAVFFRGSLDLVDLMNIDNSHRLLPKQASTQEIRRASRH